MFFFVYIGIIAEICIQTRNNIHIIWILKNWLPDAEATGSIPKSLSPKQT